MLAAVKFICDFAAMFFDEESALDLRYVAGVSWPRSGHHLMQRLLQRYFGPGFGYCDFYPPETPCCRTFPCTRQDSITFSKNHDFDLSGKIVSGVPYLVQHRAVIPAILSDFELYLRGNKNKDSREHFTNYARVRAGEWAGFMAKWVDGEKEFERILVSYEDLVSDPNAILKQVVAFFAPGAAPDEVKIANVVATESHQAVTKDSVEWKQNAGVKAFRRPEEFRFYDAKMFAELEAIAAQSRAKSPPPS